MLQRTKKLPLDASPNKDIIDTNDTILRRNYQTAAAPNASPEFVKKYSTNQDMIDAVNNLLLETYHSYTGCARISSSGDSKRLHQKIFWEADLHRFSEIISTQILYPGAKH
ncbi:hypothetical protein RhiirA1_481194 [Rhizophagus irregularis]|uniref:Uncharacterized protein n=1 Tax=Rhizophagus irregularis TaxID=588596 RepID=A0A2N0QNE8_9GLOM|nr:hypothetical protein RhiirA1_481194 [Rhizophagus irregularis]